MMSVHFEKGEKVLCYEPDPTKAKVLYDSKILGVYESKDKRGRKIHIYKVHFQGWSSSWDRKVNAEYLLKDSEENRRLQRDLAEKAQLQLSVSKDTYLYKPECSSGDSKRKKKHKSGELNAFIMGLSDKPSTTTNNTTNSTNSTTGKEYKCQSVDSSDEQAFKVLEPATDEQRVMLRISERLREFLEYDHCMIVQQGRQHRLPARIAVVSLLEHLVKENAVKLVSALTPVESSRRRATQQRADKREREFEKVVTTISLLKEMVDGLRIYFDQTVMDHLLYKQEQEYTCSFLTEENMKKCCYMDTRKQIELYLPKFPDFSDAAGYDPFYQTDIPYPAGFDGCKMRGTNVYHNAYQQQQQPMTPSQHSKQMRSYLHNVLSWHILPRSAKPAPSMIFGAPHLARLLVRLPEFLNMIPMQEEKLKIIMQHLESVVNYLEDRNDCFDGTNYATIEFVEERLHMFRDSSIYGFYKQQKRRRVQQRQIILRQQQKLHRKQKKREKQKKLREQQKKRQLQKQKLQQQQQQQQHQQQLEREQQRQRQLLLQQQQEELLRQEQLYQMHLQMQREIEIEQAELKNVEHTSIEYELQQQQEREYMLWQQQQEEMEADAIEQGRQVFESFEQNEADEEEEDDETNIQKKTILLEGEDDEQMVDDDDDGEDDDEEAEEGDNDQEDNYHHDNNSYNELSILSQQVAEDEEEGEEVDDEQYLDESQLPEHVNLDEEELEKPHSLYGDHHQQSKHAAHHRPSYHHKQYRQQYHVLQDPVSPSQQDHPQLKIRIKTSRVVS